MKIKEVLCRDYVKHLEGIVSHAFRDKTILVVGVSGGSHALEVLARLVPRRLKLCDFDRVEPANLSRTNFTIEDASESRLKVDAAAARITSINPFTEILCYAESLTEMTALKLCEMLECVDLIVAGTDDFDAQAFCNELAILHGIPAVFVGVHARAQGGRVIWVVPGETACFRCLNEERYQMAERGETERLNLAGAAGSLLDGLFIDMVAHKVAVAIIERGQDSLMGRFYERMRGRTEIVVRCDPEYEWGRSLWDAVLGDLPSEPKDYGRELRDEVLFAMDTMWLKTTKNPACSVCGSNCANEVGAKGRHGAGIVNSGSI